jgi:hypothetical protein
VRASPAASDGFRRTPDRPSSRPHKRGNSQTQNSALSETRAPRTVIASPCRMIRDKPC